MDKSSVSRLEQLDVDGVVRLLESSRLAEFEEFVKEKEIDGRKLVDVTEGIVKLWRPKVNAKKFILFIEDLKGNVDKYFNKLPDEDTNDDIINIPIECQYQTVISKRAREEQAATASNIEELLKKLVPAKSFLYRNQQRNKDKTGPSYLPMDSGNKKPRKFFRLSYDYPQLDIFSRFSKQENFDDRGYYSVKTNSRQIIQRTYKRQDSRTKYKSISTTEELHEKFPEDHLYEDLCYTDMNKDDDKIEKLNTNQIVHVKPALVKIQELFQSLKMPFFRKVEMAEADKSSECDKVEKDANVYENDTVANMYDSIHVPESSIGVSSVEKDETKVAVEDYLETVRVNKDYCDVGVRQKEDSILGYIMSMFENRFGIRRETNDPTQSEDSEDEKPGPPVSDEPRKWGEDRRPRANMADRPLPVPVENEAYYMNIDRAEAENLLMGQPDGTFVLRPSSQSSHAYTLSVSCSNAVHNVGVRRRPDGRLALGFQRRGERSFTSVTSLLRHHRRRRLLLVAAGGVIGATTLNETPHYYQTPSNLPLAKSEYKTPRLDD